MTRNILFGNIPGILNCRRRRCGPSRGRVIVAGSTSRYCCCCCCCCCFSHIKYVKSSNRFWLFLSKLLVTVTPKFAQFIKSIISKNVTLYRFLSLERNLKFKVVPLNNKNNHNNIECSIV